MEISKILANIFWVPIKHVALGHYLRQRGVFLREREIVPDHDDAAAKMKLADREILALILDKHFC